MQTQSNRCHRAEESQGIVMATPAQDHDALGTGILSVALIGPEHMRRQTVSNALAGSQARITREFTSYPDVDDVPKLLESGYDVVIVELDSDPERALDLVESICAAGSITVMIYSARSDSAMLVRCMRAGAREFITLPITEGAMDEALVRAMVRRPAGRPSKKTDGKLLVFLGAKGGSGTTTIASNFAVAVAQESHESTLLIDLNLPIGDAALGLGLRSQFSTVHALENAARLDSNFLLKLLVKHDCGLSVLAAPDLYTRAQVTVEGIEKLLAVTRKTFNTVIVDAGSKFGPGDKALMDVATTVYLVTQVSVSELRNSNRLIAEFLATYGRKPEIVLNRFTPRTLGIGEKEIEKALNQQPRWKIPSDYGTALRAQNTANALALEDSSISRVIRQMARIACGLTENPGKKKPFSLFG
jgi:pilus assembly protein CpaE